MKLLNKFYLILLPLFSIILASSIIINIDDFNKRIDEANKNYIDSNIEDALYFKNDVVFSQYFEYLEYGLEEEASIDLENIKRIIERKIEINKNYGGSIEHIILLSKDKKIVAKCKKCLKCENDILSPIIDKDFNKELVSLVDRKKHIIITPILKDNSKKIESENIYGYLIINKRLQIEDIEELKNDILFHSVVTNSLYLLAFIVVIYLVSKKVSKPINELTEKLKELDFEQYNELRIKTDIKEISFLNNTLIDMSNQIVKKQNSIIELNNTLEEKVKQRTSELESAYEDIKQYEQLFKQNKAIMLLIDPSDGSIKDANITALNFYGYEYEQMVSKNIKQINTLSNEEIEKEMKNAKEEKRSCFYFTHELKDGTLRYVEVHSGPIKLNNKDLLYSIIHDITEQKEQERIIKDKDKMLQQQAKVAAVGEMLGNISHQWRQPLSIITTHASALNVSLDFEEEIPNEMIKTCTEDVLKQCTYLSKTIDDFREFFMSDSESKKIYDLKAIFKKLEGLVKSSFENNFIHYEMQLEDNISVKINENILIQAFINICNNAKDALVASKVDTDLRFFFIKVEKKNNSAVITFKDSGGGIKDSAIDKIFEPYFTTKHPSIGTGIGLYMTNQIITKHLKGNIEVSNVEYTYDEKRLKGACFSITIPL